MSWRPSATLPALQQRAAVLHRIRQFFLARNVLELDVPVLSDFATVDPFIDSLTTSVMGQVQYLQTSPEFFLKRYLAAYQHDVYSLGKAFRQGEKGRRHSPEFTMLEWYRVDWDERQLMDELVSLVRLFFPDIAWQTFSYGELFQQFVDIDPHLASANDLKACARAHVDCDFDSDNSNLWLDLLFTHVVEPQLPAGLVGVYDYPASQAALARIEVNHDGQPVAKRFEVYIDGVELANGYWELTDSVEQAARFDSDVTTRQQQQLGDVPYDRLLVDALEQGHFPACAGVALGIDRLLMRILNKRDIKEVMSF